MAKYLLSCRQSAYMDYALHSYGHLAELGVKYMEIPFPGSGEGADNVKSILDELGLKALSVQYQLNLDKKNIVEEFARDLKYIKKLEPMYIFSSVSIKKEKDRAKGYPILKELGEMALKEGLFISIETHPYFNTNGDRGRETMENVNSEGVKINFDTANIYFYNKNVDAVEELKKVLPWLGSLHVKDCRKKYKDWYFPAVGDGEVDFPAIKSVLDTLDRTVPLTIEIEGVKGEKYTREDVENMVKKSVEYIRNVFGIDE